MEAGLDPEMVDFILTNNLDEVDFNHMIGDFQYYCSFNGIEATVASLNVLEFEYN